jgi:hypothetical protein
MQGVLDENLPTRKANAGLAQTHFGGQKWVSRVQSRWVQNDEMSILPGSMVGQKPAKKPAKKRANKRANFWAKNIANANDFWPKKGSNVHSALLKTGQ